MKKATHVAWMFELAVIDGQRAAFDALIAEMVEATEQNEPGTLEYEYYLGDDGRRCHLWERYRDSDAAMIHLATFGQRFMERFFTVLAPERMTLYGAPDERVRAALGDMSPPVMVRKAGFSRL
ncbi:MAG: antibiotic biosynthesis monooxygenase [Gemmatimonadetes bacterium]|nr:antibiotic biosynthesis monooxygenase [Gemmatimonadota bacterium]